MVKERWHGRGAGTAERKRGKTALAFAAIYLIWGSTFLGIRYAVETLPPFLMMGARHLVAGTLLYAWSRLRGTPRPSRAQWGTALVAGAFLFVGCHGLLAWAEQRVPSGLAALLSATVSLWMVLLAWLWGQQRRVSAAAAAGLALGLIGVAVLVGVGSRGQAWQTDPVRAGAIVLSELLWAVGAIYARGRKNAPPVAIFAAMQMLAGGVLLWGSGLLLGEANALHASSFTMKSLLALAFLIVFGSVVAFTAYTWLLTVSTPARVSTHAYVNPLVAVILGWAMAGEALTLRTLAGAGIILAGVGLVNRREKAVTAQQELQPSGIPEMSAAD